MFDRAGLMQGSTDSGPEAQPHRLLEEAARRLASVPDPIPLLQALFAFAPVGFQVYKANGHCLLTNKAFRDLFGAEPPPEYNVLEDEIVRRTGTLDFIHRAFRGETVIAPPIWYDPRDLKQVTIEQGRRVAVGASFFPLVDGAGQVTHVALAFKDVTAEWEARERAEQERDKLREAVDRASALAEDLRQAEERLRLTLQAADVGTWEWHIAENRVEWSSNIEAIFGLPRGTFGGTYEAWLALVHPEDRSWISERIARALETRGQYDAEFRDVRPDGAIGWQTTRGYVVVDAQGSPRALRGVVLDVTQRRSAEEELRARAEFEQHVVGIVSHDLRNPINAIGVSAAMLLRRGSLDGPQGQAVSRILSSVDRANRMIRDFMDFTRARLGGGIPVTRKPMNLHDVTQTVVNEVHLAHPERQVEMARQGDGEGLWDPDRLAQVVGNLVANAFQHSPPEERISIATRGAADAIELEVRNGGPAIPPDRLKDLFVPFKRPTDARPRGSGSIGLGLYITRQLVIAHGGTVEVRSAEGEGTTFLVRLPRLAPPS